MSSQEVIGVSRGAHSAEVRLELCTEEGIFPLAQVSATKIMLDGGEVKPGLGEVRVWVDGELHASKVRVLPAEAGAQWVGIERIK